MPKFYDTNSVIEDLCLRSGDTLMRNKGLYLSCVRDVWDEMNEDVLKISNRVKIPIRQKFCIDKRTNSINIPSNALKINSVSIIDRYGCYQPVYRNDFISDDIVDLGTSQNCACDYNCNSKLCNTIKGYEAVSSVKSDFLPNGDPISFTCVDKSFVDNQGFYYSQTQYPLRVYLSGVWASTIMQTDNKKLCQVDVDSNGCVCDTEQNLVTICDACGIDGNAIPMNDSQGNCLTPICGGDATNPPCFAPNANSWIYQCGSRMEWFNVQCGGFPYNNCGGNFNNIYNISELGNRIIFPSNFGYGEVMIRFFEDISLKNLQIPYLAKTCFMTGLQYYSVANDDKKQKLAVIYEQKFAKQKWGLFLELNKNTIAENAEIFTPKVFMPSYISNRHNHENW